MYQLAKTPLLFEHYQAHKIADKTLSVWSFFSEHYLNCNPADPDYIADMQLPFKSHNECIAINLGSLRCVKQQYSEVSFLQTLGFAVRNYQVYQPTCFTSAYPANIWQPPRQA